MITSMGNPIQTIQQKRFGMETPLQQYISSIAEYYASAAALQRQSNSCERQFQEVEQQAQQLQELFASLGIQLPGGAVRSVKSTDFVREQAMVSRSLYEAQAWCALILLCLTAIEEFVSLSRQAAESPALRTWNEEGRQLVCTLQTDLAARDPNASATLEALNLHLGERTSIIGSLQETDKRLVQAEQSARMELQKKSEHRDWLSREYSERKSQALTNALWGALIGLVIVGFGGCSYGCIAAGTTAKESMLSGALLGAVGGLLIGYIMKSDDIRRAEEALASANMEISAAAELTSSAVYRLQAHRAQLPPPTHQVRS